MGILDGIGKKNKLIADVRSFTFRYEKGCYMNGWVSYELTCRDGAYRAKVKPELIADEDAAVEETDAAFAQALCDILNTCAVAKWDGFNKFDRRVLDGRSFSLSLRYGEAGSVSAHGYMRWPEHYREFRDAADALFMPLYPRKKEEA